MAQDSLKILLFGFIIFSLFAFMSLTFIDQMGTLNEVDITDIYIDSGALNRSSYNSTDPNANPGTGNVFRERFEGAEIADIDSVSGIKTIFEDVTDYITCTPTVIIS